MRITVRVRPGASRTRVGGRYGEPSAQVEALVVAVTARAVDGAANAAVLAAVAEAFGVRARQLRLVTGARSRTKVVALQTPPPDAQDILARLLAE